MIDPLVPIIPKQKVVSWPKYEIGPETPYAPLSYVLSKFYTTDAHLAAYSAPTIKRRLSLDALKLADACEKLGGGVDMVLAIFDVDRHDGTVEAWWEQERAKLVSLLNVHKGGFIYRTRGGYRIVYTLDPIFLCSASAAAEWTTRYLAWCVHLKSRFGVDCDPACSEWVRLYRLPHATREGSDAPEEYETIGNFQRIGEWAPKLSEFDWTVGASFKKRKAPRQQPVSYVSAGDGVLFYAFRARGWVGRELERGKWIVRCPWERLHSSGDAFNSSTILYAPGPGEKLGWLKCSHAHCQNVTLKDLLAEFSKWELERAEIAAGVK